MSYLSSLTAKLINIENPILSRIFHGAKWSMVATFFSRGMPIIAMIIVARFLSQNEYGEVGIIRNSIGMFSVFAGMAMGLTATRYVALYRTRDKQATGEIITLSLLISTISGVIIAISIFYFSPWIADKVLANRNLVTPLKISALILLFESWKGTEVGILTGFEKFRLLAITDIISGLLSIPIIVIGTYQGGVNGAIIGLAISGLISVLLYTTSLTFLIRSEDVKLTRKISSHQLQVLWSFSIPALLSGLIFAPSIWAGSAMLVHEENGYSEMAVFSAANQWFALLLFLPGVLTNTLLPIFSDLVGTKDMVKLKESLSIGYKAIILFILPCGFVLSLISPYIMGLYGERYSERWLVLAVIILAALLASIQNMITNLLAALGNMWIRVTANIVWAVTFITTTYILLGFKYGAMSLSSGLMIAFFVKLILVVFVVRKEIHDI